MFWRNQADGLLQSASHAVPGDSITLPLRDRIAESRNTWLDNFTCPITILRRSRLALDQKGLRSPACAATKAQKIGTSFQCP